MEDTETDQQEVGADGATTPAAEEAPKIIMPLLSMLESTEIRSRRVAVIVPNGRLVIDGSSAINADGTSGSVRGTSLGQGASFIGQGGFCGSISRYAKKTYGRFDQRFDDPKIQSADRVGSAGMTGAYAKATAGGGSIHITVDSINL